MGPLSMSPKGKFQNLRLTIPPCQGDDSSAGQALTTEANEERQAEHGPGRIIELTPDSATFNFPLTQIACTKDAIHMPGQQFYEKVFFLSHRATDPY